MTQTKTKRKDYAVMNMRGNWRIVDSATGKPVLNQRAMPLDRGGFVDQHEAKQHLAMTMRFRAKLDAMRSADMATDTDTTRHADTT